MTTPTAAPRPARTRVSPLRLGVVLLCTVAVSAIGIRSVAAVVTTPTTPGPSAFTSYVDVTTTPAYPFETPSGPAQANVVLSFVVANPTSSCTPAWGGAYSLDEAAKQLELDRRITQLRLTGGDARVSFGGQAGTELAAACTQAGSLRRAYQSVVDRYELTSIDLDLEGATLEDAVGSARRADAIKLVQDHAIAAGRSLAVWLTLPVSPTGLTASGTSVVAGMLSAGVDLAGVNGMTMDFGTVSSLAAPESDLVIQASTALRAQVSTAFSGAGQALRESQSWAKVGITPMIGQNDVASERFTLADAGRVNQFAREHGVGQLSMWSLNRDSTCAPPLPSVLTVVQTACSGIDQGAQRFAIVLSTDLTAAPPAPAATGSPSAPPATPAPVSPSPDPAASAVDDPTHSPFPIWDPLGTYPGGTKIVWHHRVFQARFWTTGFAPDTPGATADGSPWSLIGPVLPGDTPAPLPTLPEGTYPAWDANQAYVAGTRVQFGLVPYQAKWWSQGQEPDLSAAGGTPWVIVTAGS